MLFLWAKAKCQRTLWLLHPPTQTSRYEVWGGVQRRFGERRLRAKPCWQVWGAAAPGQTLPLHKGGLSIPRTCLSPCRRSAPCGDPATHKDCCARSVGREGSEPAAASPPCSMGSCEQAQGPWDDLRTDQPGRCVQDGVAHPFRTPSRHGAKSGLTWPHMSQGRWEPVLGALCGGPILSHTFRKEGGTGPPYRQLPEAKAAAQSLGVMRQWL